MDYELYISEAADRDVEQTIDYQGGYNGLPSANVVEFRLPDTNKVIFRPSGTEPKVKAYLFARGASAEAADSLLDALQDAAYALVEQ